MPLSEFLKFGEQKTTSFLADLSSFSENEVVELVWENGQIVMQGQSNRANKRNPTPTSNNLSLQMPMIREKHKENSSSPKMEKLYLMDEMPLSVPTNEMDDEIVPWVNNNNLQHEYSSELVPEASGLTATAQNNFTLMDTTCGSNQMAVKNSSKVDSSRFGVFPSSSSRIASVPSHKGVLCDNKAVEPGVASSSVCSGSSPDRTSNDLSNSLKRKYCDNEEESGCPSGDFEEEESLGVRKAAAPVRGGTGSKKSRAAEVHNLSERRRRDRINEKMSALQELIPNCNKTDKASMLDEAIEYLKTLQLQVQIMSMGTGLCVPPMMYPLGMHATHFPPMGMGIGPMGLGIHEMNGGYPLYPIPPPMQRAQLSSPPFSWPSTFPGIAASNFPVFGHPGIGIPISTPKPPTISKSGQPATSSAVGLDASRMGIQVQVPCTLKPEDMVKTKSSKLRNNNDPNPSINQTCQIQASTQEQVQNDNQLLHDCDSPAIKLTSSTDVSGSEAGSD